MTPQADRDDVVPMAFFGALIAAFLFVVGWCLMAVLIEVLAGRPLGEGLYTLVFFPWALIMAIPVALLTAFPVGIVYGRLILWRGAATRGMAALAGAATGVTLIGAMVALGGEGLRDILLIGSALTGLGAISGLLAFRLVVGGGRQIES